MQITVLFISLAGILLVSAAFVFAIMRSGERDDDYASVTGRAYPIRRWWMVALCLLGGFITVATLSPFPLRALAGVEPTVVNAVGGQWYWKLDVTTFPAGKPVQFRVSADDVNHGFAIYAPDNRIVAQTQAMPGYVNKLNVTFDEPGTYRILCLEYCGLAHHAMITELNVTEAR